MFSLITCNVDYIIFSSKLIIIPIMVNSSRGSGDFRTPELVAVKPSTVSRPGYNYHSYNNIL